MISAEIWSASGLPTLGWFIRTAWRRSVQRKLYKMLPPTFWERRGQLHSSNTVFSLFDALTVTRLNPWCVESGSWDRAVVSGAAIMTFSANQSPHSSVFLPFDKTTSKLLKKIVGEGEAHSSLSYWLLYQYGVHLSVTDGLRSVSQHQLGYLVLMRPGSAQPGMARRGSAQLGSTRRRRDREITESRLMFRRKTT